MKKIILALVFTLPFLAQSQNHYIIPDIGAPDMAVYVEMIAPHDQKGYFGTDGLYLPGVDDEVTVNVTKNAQFVTFGPMVVSWEGRMISTHIFVDKLANPTLVTPDPAFQVEFNIAGTTVPASRSFIYNIVKPQSLGVNGDLSGINEKLLGAGSLGIRSERGAMILDSIKLKANTSYSVSKNDPDGDLSNGNQGYLPITILCKGPAVGNNSSINVDATTIHGAAGGGGGGGIFQDHPANANTGNFGGDGFTGGGAGGANWYVTGGGSYKPLGMGSGGLGNSLSGIQGKVPSSGWEASYGGTGHPFGTNGVQSTSGTSADARGGFGGGSGYRNQKPGGCGGNATEGDGDNVTSGTTGGQVVGNSMIVPLFGGSGGAGGNPEAGFFNPFARSGNGGGGGGGISLFAPVIDNISLTANGQFGSDNFNSASDDDSHGGSGSGGSAAIMSKLGITNFSLSAEGGTRDGRSGGAGRVRFDGMRTSSDPTITPNDASKYRGLSTDTSNYIKPRHVLFGTKDPTKDLDIYIKPENDVWILDRSITVSSNNWLATANFPVGHDDKYYVVVVQKETKQVTDYTYVPEYVLSQAATNVFIFDSPKIYCPEDTTFEVVNCKDIQYFDSIPIQSIGGDYLPLNIKNNWVFGDRGITVTNGIFLNVSPQDPDSIHYVKLVYNKIPGQTGTITDTLLVAYNEGYTDTCRIAVNIQLNDPKVAFLDENEISEIDTLYLGEICVGELGTGTFNIRNDSEFDLSDLDLRIRANGNNQETDFMASPTTFTSLPKSNSIKVDINFNDLDNNTFKDGVSVTLLVFSQECADPIDSLVLSIKVFTSELALSVANKTLDFGNVQVGGTKDLTVSLTNVGDKPARVVTPPAVNAPFTLVSSSEALPFTLAPTNLDASAKIDFTYRFTPIAEGNFLDSTLYSSEENISENSCEAEIKLYLKATAQAGEVSYKDTLDFGLLYECVTDSTDIFIKNESSSLITIDTANAIIIGNNANYFRFAAKPSTISVGGQNNFLIGFIPPTIPTTAGVKVARLEFDLDPAGAEKEVVYIKAEVDTFLVDYSPGKPFDMGQIPVGFNSAPQVMTITNNGKLPRIVTGFAQSANSKVIITHNLGFPVTIPAGGSEDFDVDISLLATDTGPYSETDTAIFEMCDNKLPIEIIAEGVEGELEIVTDLNLGAYPPCFDITQLVTFRNAGNADIVLDSVFVEENGVIIDTITNLPQTLTVAAGANIYANVIEISKTNLQIGTTYKAVLVAYVSENGATQVYTKEITIDIKSGLIINPNPVDFGSVNLNSNVTRSVEIKTDPTVSILDTTSLMVNVNRGNLTIDYQEYTIPLNNFIFNKGDKTSRTFNIDFTPLVSQNYDDTLNIVVNFTGCTYTVPLILKGSGLAGDTLLVYVKDTLEVEPNINDFRIPIYGKLMSNSGSQKTVDVELSNLDINFNKTIFFPMSLTNGEYLSRTTDAALSRISIKMDSPVQVTSGEEVILTEMIGTTMLGNQKDNLIQISSFDLLDDTGISEKQFHGGLFNLTICQQGGDRLLEYTNGFNYSLLKSTNNLEIQANLIEAGYHKVSIITTTGQTEIISELTRQKNDRSNYTINFDTSHLSSGVYYIVFETPDRFKTEKLIIIR